MTIRESAPPRGMVRNAFHLGLGQIATTLLTILLSAALARMLGPSEFGVMYLVTAIAGFAWVVIDWGHGALIIRETARHPDKSGNLLGSALAIRSLGSLIACLVAIVITWVLGYDMLTRLLSGALILCWLPQYLGLSFGWVFRGRERMDCDALINVAHKLATLVCSVVCLSLGWHLSGLIVAWGIAGSLTLALAIFIHRRLRLPRLSATKSTAVTLLRDGSPIFAMTLAIAVEPFFNANILYKMTTPAVVGWYGAAWTVAGTLIAPATVLGATMYPRLSTVVGDPIRFRRAFDVAFRPLLLLAVLAAVGTYLFADVPVALIYGKEGFGPAAATLRAFAPVLMLMYVDVFLAMAILSLGRTGRLATVKVVSVVLTAALAFFFVPFCQARSGNGGLGVMYSMAIGESLMIVAAGFLLREVVDARTIGVVLRSLAAGMATVLLIRLLPALAFYWSIPLCVLVFAGLSLLTGAVKRSDLAMLAALRR